MFCLRSPFSAFSSSFPTVGGATTLDQTLAALLTPGKANTTDGLLTACLSYGCAGQIPRSTFLFLICYLFCFYLLASHRLV